MDDKKRVEFSKEIYEFSKLINATFENVSKDVKLLTNKSELSTKATKSDIDKVKKEMAELRYSLNSVKTMLIEVEKKLKKNRSVIQEQKKPVSNKQDIKILASEIADMKLSIKNIEHKLKMD